MRILLIECTINIKTVICNEIGSNGSKSFGTVVGSTPKNTNRQVAPIQFGHVPKVDFVIFGFVSAVLCRHR